MPHSAADIGFVLADGLSPRALTDHGAALLAALVERARRDRYSLAPPVIATQARVALGDHIAQAMGVQTLLVLIGERPGLSVADSLGIYLTHLPRPAAPTRTGTASPTSTRPRGSATNTRPGSWRVSCPAPGNWAGPGWT